MKASSRAAPEIILHEIRRPRKTPGFTGVIRTCSPTANIYRMACKDP